jgi:hypothetical protein
LNKGHIAKLDNDIIINEQNIDPDDKVAAGYYGFEGLCREGVVEYLDAEEEETAMIVMTPEELDESRQLLAGYEIQEDDSGDLNKRTKTPMKTTTHMWTHCEIHPSMILGICASIIPFPDHNQVRLLYILDFVDLTNVYSLLVIRTSPLWVNKQWASSSRISTKGWTPWPIFFTIRKSPWPPPDPWSF